MTKFLKDLRVIAQEAYDRGMAEGTLPWQYTPLVFKSEKKFLASCVSDRNQTCLGRLDSDLDTQFVATFGPDVVLNLIEQIYELKEEISEMHAEKF